MDPKYLKGIPASQGISIGKAQVIDSFKVRVYYQYILDEEEVEREIGRLEAAFKATEDHFKALKEKFQNSLENEAYLFDTYLMILNDKAIRHESIDLIKREHINAEWALKKSLESIKAAFQKVEDPYIKSRIEDVEGVIERVLRNLTGNAYESVPKLNSRVIIVARELSPMDTTELDISRVMGLVTELGGKTSHTAIVAQSLDIPAVVGLFGATSSIKDGDLLIVDGDTGEVIVNPDENLLVEYQERQLDLERQKRSIIRASHLPAITRDGLKISVLANIEFIEEIVAAKSNGCEGIGLYRTEFLYLRARQMPTEEELYEDYRDVVELMKPYPVTIRTLDLGGDKFITRPGMYQEINPALGLRAIRLCLKEKELFKTQLRAILRASAHGDVRLMFPMISGLGELLEAKEVLREVMEELDSNGLPYKRDLKVGIMVEVPSAVTLSDILAPHVDFFSIGTNDLVQYTLAIDRVNELVANMYQPYHPAILRMIMTLVKVAEEHRIELSVCGEMAGDPLCIPILIGAGIRTLSMNPRSIPGAKYLVRELEYRKERNRFFELLSLDTAEKVRKHLENMRLAVT